MKGREGFADAQKATMKLSREILEGLHITDKNAVTHLIRTSYNYAFYNAVKSFCEITRYLHSIDEDRAPYLLSEHFTQDPIENYFGQQRSRGERCQNRTVQAFISSAQSLRVQGSLAMMTVRGNSRCKRLNDEKR